MSYCIAHGGRCMENVEQLLADKSLILSIAYALAMMPPRHFALRDLVF